MTKRLLLSVRPVFLKFLKHPNRMAVKNIKNNTEVLAFKNCKKCSTEFRPKSKKQRYCSKRCRINADYYGRENEFLKFYDELGSMNAALKKMGYPGSISNWYYWAKSTLDNRIYYET